MFTTLPQVAEVIARGPTKSSVRLHTGQQVDLRVIQPKHWGAALQYFTGSKDHNVRLREIALKTRLFAQRVFADARRRRPRCLLPRRTRGVRKAGLALHSARTARRSRRIRARHSTPDRTVRPPRRLADAHDVERRRRRSIEEMARAAQATRLRIHPHHRSLAVTGRDQRPDAGTLETAARKRSTPSMRWIWVSAFCKARRSRSRPTVHSIIPTRCSPRSILCWRHCTPRCGRNTTSDAARPQARFAIRTWTSSRTPPGRLNFEANDPMKARDGADLDMEAIIAACAGNRHNPRNQRQSGTARPQRSATRAALSMWAARSSSPPTPTTRRCWTTFTTASRWRAGPGPHPIGWRTPGRWRNC